MGQRIKGIADHPKLFSYFEKGYLIKNEQDILTKNGKVLRPDRIVIKDNRATIIDYKTGKRNPAYHEQIYAYADALEAMGYEIEGKILIYINEDITLDFI
nr:PD-(D/E)XK nuclease family protein [Arenibacter sp. N53]